VPSLRPAAHAMSTRTAVRNPLALNMVTYYKISSLSAKPRATTYLYLVKGKTWPQLSLIDRRRGQPSHPCSVIFPLSLDVNRAINREGSVIKISRGQCYENLERGVFCKSRDCNTMQQTATHKSTLTGECYQNLKRGVLWIYREWSAIRLSRGECHYPEGILPYWHIPHNSGPIQRARGEVGLKPSAAARPNSTSCTCPASAYCMPCMHEWYIKMIAPAHVRTFRHAFAPAQIYINTYMQYPNAVCATSRILHRMAKININTNVRAYWDTYIYTQVTGDAGKEKLKEFLNEVWCTHTHTNLLHHVYIINRSIHFFPPCFAYIYIYIYNIYVCMYIYIYIYIYIGLSL